MTFQWRRLRRYGRVIVVLRTSLTFPSRGRSNRWGLKNEIRLMSRLRRAVKFLVIVQNGRSRWRLNRSRFLLTVAFILPRLIILLFWWRRSRRGWPLPFQTVSCYCLQGKLVTAADRVTRHPLENIYGLQALVNWKEG